MLQASGLRVDQTIALPTDVAVADAVRRVYRLGQFSDVQVVEERRVGDGVFLAIVVSEAPRLNDVKIQGVKSDKDRDALREILPFVRGARLTQTDLQQLEKSLLNASGDIPLHNRFRALFTLKALKNEDAVQVISKGKLHFRIISQTNRDLRIR